MEINVLLSLIASSIIITASIAHLVIVYKQTKYWRQVRGLKSDLEFAKVLESMTSAKVNWHNAQTVRTFRKEVNNLLGK